MIMMCLSLWSLAIVAKAETADVLTSVNAAGVEWETTAPCGRAVISCLPSSEQAVTLGCMNSLKMTLSYCCCCKGPHRLKLLFMQVKANQLFSKFFPYVLPCRF